MTMINAKSLRQQKNKKEEAGDAYRFHPKQRAAIIAHACELYFLFQLG